MTDYELGYKLCKQAESSFHPVNSLAKPHLQLSGDTAEGIEIGTTLGSAIGGAGLGLLGGAAYGALSNKSDNISRLRQILESMAVGGFLGVAGGSLFGTALSDRQKIMQAKTFPRQKAFLKSIGGWKHRDDMAPGEWERMKEKVINWAKETGNYYPWQAEMHPFSPSKWY